MNSEQPSVPVSQRRKYVAEGPDDTLHEISTLLIQEGNLDPVYNRMLDAAMSVMSSDMASMQLLDPERNQLRLLAWKGFHPQSAVFWKWVYLDSASTCGLALFAGSRVVVPDVETCDFMAGTADLDEYRRSKIRAVQSTPLVSRSCQLLGMISTHWREPHQSTERALWRMDVLARQAADLLERDRTEAVLALRNDAETVLANTPFLFTRCSSDLRYLFVSEAYAKMTGHRPEEVVGKKIVEVMGKTGFNTILPHVKAVLSGHRVEYETEVHFKDVGPRLLHVIYTPDKDPLGQVDGWIASILDITARKQTEAALRESEQRLRWLASIIESSDDVIVSKNLAGTITSWNRGAERVFGYTAEEAIGQPITIVIPEDRQSEEHEILTRIRRGEPIDHFETVRQRKDGSLIAVSLTISPVRDAEGKIVGASKIARDITEQKRSQEQITTLAREAEHRSKNLLANVQAMAQPGDTKMFSKTQIALSAAMVLSIGFPASAAPKHHRVYNMVPAAQSDQIPVLDVNPVCHGIATQGELEEGLRQTSFQQCVQSEQATRDEIKKEWSTFSASDKSHCVALAKTGGEASYTELITCMEMARDVRKLHADQQKGSDTSSAPGPEGLPAPVGHRQPTSQ